MDGVVLSSIWHDMEDSKREIVLRHVVDILQPTYHPQSRAKRHFDCLDFGVTTSSGFLAEEIINPTLISHKIS
jgi:hypothetical protein